MGRNDDIDGKDEDRKPSRERSRSRGDDRKKDGHGSASDGLSGDDRSEYSDDSRRKSRKKRSSKHHSRKHRKKSSSRRDDYSDDDEGSSSSPDYFSSDSEQSRRHKKKRRRHHSRKRDDSSSSDSEDDRRKKKRRHKDRKKKKHKKKERKRDVDKKEDDYGAPTFGKYGILRPSDMQKKQRSFSIWMEEVKGVLDFNGPKWELQEYFKEYAEDYNTATLPHIKYYDYDKWEMDEYQKNKAKAEASGSSMIRDEAAHMQSLQERAAAKKKEEFAMVTSMMNKDKIAEMKRKKQLQTEMAHAYRTGDHQTYQRLKKRLEPEA